MKNPQQTSRKRTKQEAEDDKKEKTARKKLPRRDYELLYGLSGGYCAYCKEPFIDIETLEVIAHQAHVIARDNENLPSYRDISYKLKDQYENLFLLHPTCHKKTENYPLEELQLIKKNHEKHIRDTLRGIYNPFPVGNGKYLKYPHIIYNEVEKPFSYFHASINLLFFVGLIALFSVLLFLAKPEQYLTGVICLVGGILICTFATVKTIKIFKERKPYIVHEAECIFAGCNGKVTIRRQTFFDTLSKITIPQTGIGVCNFDSTHTFTVPNDLRLSNRGDYHHFVIYNSK